MQTRIAEVVEVIEPNEDMLRITRLYLEKRDGMSEQERSVFVRAIELFMNPLIIERAANSKGTARP